MAFFLQHVRARAQAQAQAQARTASPSTPIMNAATAMRGFMQHSNPNPARPLATSAAPAFAATATATVRVAGSKSVLRWSHRGMIGTRAGAVASWNSRHAVRALYDPIFLRFFATGGGGSASPPSVGESGVRELTMDEIVITKACAERLQFLKEEAGHDELRLRLAVDGGGCSGFSYVFEIDTNELNPDQDCVYTAHNGSQLVLDDMTLEYVQGATIDYVQEMIKEGFEVVSNPNAEAACGCGASFAPKDMDWV